MCDDGHNSCLSICFPQSVDTTLETVCSADTGTAYRMVDSALV
jgi:hypothetical protein